MIRKKLIAKHVGHDKKFRLRGEDVSRVEAFSDAVFGFAITLVVVSLEVPGSFSQLQQTMLSGLLSFAICFAVLAGVWLEHYRYFRSYGLNDAGTILLNMILLFVVLFYIYPLKFLFNLLTGAIFPGAQIGESIQNQQWPALMMIYGAGFVAIYTVFLLLFMHAYRKRKELDLNEVEMSITLERILSTLLLIGIGLASILIAALGGVAYVSWSGWIYLLIIPVQILVRRVLQSMIGARQDKLAAKPESEASTGSPERV